ncbi:MAG: hypothetical protein MJZ23_00975 [Paludibacteraceae bacterium]|nr:hypothetical protein [Paludibacteraceae bacterium]
MRILFDYGKEADNKYRVFRVHHHATMTAERLKRSEYPSEPNADKYFCYVFDEEVNLGNLDIAALLESVGDNDGSPIFKTGKEIIEYRK